MKRIVFATNNQHKLQEIREHSIMIRTLNSLRFILILMIVISHSALPMSQGLPDYLGECPVAIFFVISGFVLSLSKG